MNVGELFDELLNWPDEVEISFGSHTGTPPQQIIGDPVLIVKNGERLALPDCLVIGWIDPAAKRVLGWS
jgi:hypothetical protein